MKDSTKEKAKGFLSSITSALDKGWNASKNALGKAGNAVQDFSDKSVVAIEKKQFENKRKKEVTELGELVYTKFNKKAMSISPKEADVANLLSSIKNCEKEISKREKMLKEADPETKEEVKKLPVNTAKKTVAKTSTKSTSKPAKKTVAKASTTTKTAKKATTKKVTKK